MTDHVGEDLEIHEITLQRPDPHALAAFWAALLEREIRPGDMPQDDSVLVVPLPGGPGLLFLRVPEGKTAKNRIHFDLWPTSTRRDEQVERAARSGRGGRGLTGGERTGPGGWCSPTRRGTSAVVGRGAAGGRAA